MLIKPAKMPRIEPAAVIELTPGALQTTKDANALEAGEAAEVLNCDTSRGVWEIDARYRRFQEPPEATVIYNVPRQVPDTPFYANSVSADDRSGSTIAILSPSSAKTPGGGVATSFGTFTGNLISQELRWSTLTPDLPAVEWPTSDATVLTAVLTISAYGSMPSGSIPDLIEDYVQLTLAGTPIGTNLATNQVLEIGVSEHSYNVDLLALGVTLADLQAHDVGIRAGWSTGAGSGSVQLNVDYASIVVYAEIDGDPEYAFMMKGEKLVLAVASSQTIPPAFIVDGFDPGFVDDEGRQYEAYQAQGGSDYDMWDFDGDGLFPFQDTYLSDATENLNGAKVSLSADCTTITFDMTEMTDEQVARTICSAINTGRYSIKYSLETGISYESEPFDILAFGDAYYVDPQGIGYGNYGGFDELGAVYGRAARKVAAGTVTAAMGNDWSDVLSNLELASGPWFIWQYARHLFYTNPDQGVWRSTIGHVGADVTDEDGFTNGVWIPVYEDSQSPGNTGDATATYAFPNYEDQAIFNRDGSTDAVEMTAITCGNISAPTAGGGPYDFHTDTFAEFDTDDKVHLFVGNTNKGWNNGTLTFKVNIGDARDFSKGNVCGFFMKSLETTATTNDGSDAFTPNGHKIRIEDGGGTDFEAALIGEVITGVINDSDEPNGGRLYAFVNLKPFAQAGVDLTDIVEIEITVGIRVYGFGEYVLENFYTNGNYYHSTSNSVVPLDKDENLEYAYNFTEGTDVSQARTLVVPALNNGADDLLEPDDDEEVDPGLSVSKLGHLGGYRAWSSQNKGNTSPFLGSTLNIAVPMADSPFTIAAAINLYRKIGDAWYLINTADNDEVMLFDDTLDDQEILADGVTYPETELSFDEEDPSTSGIVKGVICGCAWKGSNIFSKTDGKVYMSRTNTLDEVLWDNVVLTNEPGSLDLGPPRTSVVADDTVSPMILLLPAENLYAFTERESYVFVSGDTAYNSSLPRKIDGVRGVLGTRAGCVFGDRVLAGAIDGLWAIKKSTDYGEQPDDLQELTRTIRESWVWLLGGSLSTVVVRHHQGQIWCFNSDRYLHRCRDGRWISGQWADGMVVYAATSDPKRGLVIQTGDGSLGVIGPFITDGGTDVEGTNGIDVEWTYKAGRLQAAGTITRVTGYYVSEEEESGVSFGIEGRDDSSSVDCTAVGARQVNKSFRRFKSDYFDVTISGKARDVVSKVAIEVSPRKVTRGQG